MMGHWTARMADPWTLATFTGLFVVAYWFLSPKKKYKLPPQPFYSLPVVGNVLQLMKMKKKAYEEFYDMSKDPKYGPVFMVNLCGRPAVILNNIEVTREALLKKANDFANRPHFYSMDMFSEGGKDILMGQYGPVWKFHRKVAHWALRSFGSGEKLQTVVQNSVLKVTKDLEENLNTPIDVKPYISNLVFNMLCGLCLGKEYELNDPDFLQFVNITKEALDAMGNGLPADLFPWLRHFPSSRTTQFFKLMNNLIGFLKREFIEHKDTFDPDNLRDITDYLLHTQKEAEEEEQDMKDVLTDTHLILTIADMFGAGIDTVTHTLHWAVAFLAKHPEVQRKMQEELDRELGDQLPTLGSRAKLPYTEACLWEIMRRGTIAVLGIPVATARDTSVAGYDIPKDTIVAVNMWALSNDDAEWENPDVFRPERFLDDDGDVAPLPKSFIPFSIGRRQCLGEAMARSMLLLILPMLFQRLTFEQPDGQELTMEMEDSAIVSIPKTYKVVVKARN